MLNMPGTVFTPLLTPYLPVISEARVAAQTGAAQTLVKVTPEALSSSRFGVEGKCIPISYPFRASTPMSSPIINNILGGSPAKLCTQFSAEVNIRNEINIILKGAILNFISGKLYLGIGRGSGRKV